MSIYLSILDIILWEGAGRGCYPSAQDTNLVGIETSGVGYHPYKKPFFVYEFRSLLLIKLYKCINELLYIQAVISVMNLLVCPMYIVSHTTIAMSASKINYCIIRIVGARQVHVP